MTDTARIELRYAPRMPEDAWLCPEGAVPESVAHNLANHHLYSVLSFWAKRAARPLFVARNLAVRWIEASPKTGVDPDVCVLDPPPPNVEALASLCLWKPGHVAPPINFEIVSASHPYKDYVSVHERYAAFGARELVVVDALLLGPRSFGGPFPLQVWRRDGAVFERQYAGSGPVFSETLEAWLLLDDGLLQIADDYAGRDRWPTEEAYERAEKERALIEKERALIEKERALIEKERALAESERERAEKEREHARRLDVERRLAELEARLTHERK